MRDRQPIRAALQSNGLLHVSLCTESGCGVGVSLDAEQLDELIAMLEERRHGLRETLQPGRHFTVSEIDEICEAVSKRLGTRVDIHHHRV